MRRLLPACSLLLFAACATAGAGSGDDVIVGDDTPTPDANPDPDPPDARPPAPDAMVGPQNVTLSQATSTTLVTPNTLACSNTASGYTLENHYYRVFKLSDFGIATTFTATRVDFGIEDAVAVTPPQTVTVRLHSMSGTTLTNASLTLLYGQNVSIPNQSNTSMSVTLTSPVVVPAGSTLVLELFAPAFAAAGNDFYPGSSTSGESGPSYIRADDCGVTEPTAYTTVDNTVTVDLVMSVSGTKP
jgi:hypothetical protein